MLRPSTGWSPSAWAAPATVRANAAAMMVRWMVIVISWGSMPDTASDAFSVALVDGPLIIIDQTDRIDNEHRPRQFEPHRPEPARRSRRAAHRVQCHACRRPGRPWPVGHEPQPRPPAHAVWRRAPDPKLGGHAPNAPGTRPDRSGADRPGPDHHSGVTGQGVRCPDSRSAVPDRS